ncbi:MAG: chromosome segregation protein SMC, partial [Eggerthellaceae bacterium]|nr:chromosome segregation protein SMC [Eggerthellaceae bacterium]
MAKSSPWKDSIAEFNRFIVPEPEYEVACERALGQALNAFALSSDVDIAALHDTLAGQDLSGDVALLLSDVHASCDARAATISGGEPLLDHVFCKKDRGLAEALLGDVLVFRTFADAVAAAGSASNLRIRLTTLAGDMLCPDGLVLLAGSEDTMGVLSRRRRMGECTAEAESQRHEMADVDERRKLAASALEEARNDALSKARLQAVAEGRVRAAENDLRNAAARVSSATTELNASLDLATKLESKHSQVKPLIEQMEADIAVLEERTRTFGTRYSEAETALNKAREESHAFSDRLSEASMALNGAQSAHTLAQSRLNDRQRDLKSLELRIKTSQMIIGRKLIALGRLSELEDLYAALITRLDAINPIPPATGPEDSGDESTSLAGRTAAARTLTRDLRASYDEVFGRLSDSRVEEVQLKLQVQAAIDVITRECKTPLETAIKLPELADRQAAEERAGMLKRRITNLGTVNPEAAEEYLEVKKRYDFLSGQLADLEEARAALKKIDTIIDSRMRSDFVDTFATVNDNFREVFAILFPGGSAELVFTDPDDLENTGVEVIAQPRGKRITKMMLMSGGEKSLVALALLFAVYKTRTTPFYVLDEVEAALDDTNLRRLLAYLN